MSRILDQLKQAEAQRERVIAERKRLEAEADAALSALERERLAQAAQPPARPPGVAAAAPAVHPMAAPPVEDAASALADAERRRSELAQELEAERAHAAQAVAQARLEEALRREAGAPPRAGLQGRGRWLRGGLLAALLAGLALYMLPDPESERRPPTATASIRERPPVGAFALRLDRDDEAFAARVRARGEE
jgi:hypothetical protein